MSVGESWREGRIGQEVELFGQLFPRPSPANPGSPDPRPFWEDQGLFALLFVKNAAGVRILQAPAALSPAVWVAELRAALRRQIEAYVRPAQRGVALALILGDQSALTGEQIDGYQRTGVFHVLAVSGQHLVLLCMGLGFMLRVLGLPRRQQARWLLGFVLLYTLLTGARPPILRAAFMVAALGLGALLRRTTQPLNSLALAWLLTAALGPADLFQPGVQLSFLAVLVLFLGATPLWRWLSGGGLDPLDAVAREYEAPWLKLLRLVSGWLAALFLSGLVVWLATAPLTAARFHLFSPIAVLVGPPLVCCTSVALSAGFVLLLVGWLLSPLADFLGGLINLGLSWSEALVAWAERMPGGHVYVPDVPEPWLWLGYAGLFLLLFQPQFWAWRKSIAAALVAWLCVGTIWSLPTPPSGLRLTALYVGHGSCAIAETPEGRVLLFDAGSLGGPETANWVIAPFLWSRGHTRIDEVFLSHSDLDHFNGLPSLLDRFRVGQVTTNPSFMEKPIAGVHHLMARLRRAATPLRSVSAGQALASGSLRIEALHPPAKGPAGNENVRSLVLLLRYGDAGILLTGDLEPPGLGMVTHRPAPRVDVLVAPHHGSPLSNTAEFAAWAKAPLVISSEGWPRGRRPDPYSGLGSRLWRTFEVGGVTLESDGQAIEAQAFRSQERWSKGKEVAAPANPGGVGPDRMTSHPSAAFRSQP